MSKVRLKRKIASILIVIFTFLVSGIPITDAGLDDWTMFHHDQYNTGESTSTGPESSNLLWSYTTWGYSVRSSPAVVDGRVYFGSNDNNFYCLNALTGEHIWNYSTGNQVRSSPAVADGRVYVGSDNRSVYCLNALSGLQIWKYTIGSVVDSSPAIADGKVYVGAWDDRVYCLDAGTGNQIWNYTTQWLIDSSPAVTDGRVYIGSNDWKIYCFGSAITHDDIMNKLGSMSGADLDEIKDEIDALETKLDECCTNSTSTQGDILSKLDLLLERFGLAVGGTIIPVRELKLVLDAMSDNLHTVIILALFGIAVTWIARKQAV